MDIHAKEVWIAWLNGREVEIWDRKLDRWLQHEPDEEPTYNMPHYAPDRWRIKPDRETFLIRYRVGIFYDAMGHPEAREVFPCDYQDAPLDRMFARWDGPERVAEVEVEL